MNKYKQYTMQGVDLSRCFKAHSLVWLLTSLVSQSLIIYHKGM